MKKSHTPHGGPHAAGIERERDGRPGRVADSPAAEGARAYYGLLTLTPPSGETSLFAFPSCARFSGRFAVAGQHLSAIVDTENLSLGPGETWTLEELSVVSGRDRSRLLADVAD